MSHLRVLLPLTAAALALSACIADVSSSLGDDDSGAQDGDVASHTTAGGAANITLEALFQVPSADGSGDATLEDKVVSLFDQAGSGSVVRMSMYGFRRTDAANAIVNASKRGADVKVILDKEENEEKDASGNAIKGDNNPEVEILKNGLPAGSLIECSRGNGSCQGTGIDHNKFYIFSKLSDGSKDVVVQASENLTSRLLHNNMIISRNDSDLYAGYLAYWKDLAAQHEDLNYYRHVDGAHTISYFFPREDGDTVVSVLDKVKPTSTCEIRIAMAFWNTARKAIADRLVTLKHGGCDVRVLTRSEEQGGVAGQDKIIHQLRAGHIKVGVYPNKTNGVNIHSKYMTIDAQYDTQGQGYEHRQLVFTGSHNYTGGALRANDETLMRVDDATVFAKFHHNWGVIRSQIPDKDFHD